MVEPNDLVRRSHHRAVMRREDERHATVDQGPDRFDDAQRLFDRVTRHPARHPGALVFLSDLTAELASVGSSWSQVGIDYEAVTDRLVALHHRGQVSALRLAELSELAVTLLASGPQTQIYVGAPDGGPPELLDPAIFQARREELRTMIRADLDRMVARGRH